MKPHLKVRLRPEAPVAGSVPYWEDIISSKAHAPTTFHRPIDEILARHGLAVWATHEYRPQADAFSNAEIAAGLDRVYRLILQEHRVIPPALLTDISLLPTVEYVRLGQIGVTDIPPAEEAAVHGIPDEESREAIHLPEAHLRTRGDPDVIVAILDTGVDLEHPELAGRLLPGYDFVDIIDGAGRFFGDYLDADETVEDPVGHGTHVAGIVAASGRSMPAGVVPECRLLPVRVLGALDRGSKRIGAGLVDNITSGIKWAIDHGARVINLSLGVEPVGSELPHEEVIEYARSMGVTVVAASGNDGSGVSRYFPGALPYVITVGAFDRLGDVAAFSTYGDHVDFLAPGAEIYSSIPGARYAFSSGTSQATPFVAGAVAMLHALGREHRRRVSDGQVKHVLRHTADRPDRRFRTRKAGFGRLNTVDALRLLEHKLTTTEIGHG